MATKQHFSDKNLPREPSQYYPHEHAVIKKKKREIPGWLIEYLIKNGHIRDKGGNRYVFWAVLETYDSKTMETENMEWVMPIKVKRGRRNIVLTSPYILGEDRDEVMARMNVMHPDN